MKKINPKIIGIVIATITLLLLGVVTYDSISPDAEPAPELNPSGDTGTD